MDKAIELINCLAIVCMAFINICDSLIVALIITILIRYIIHLRNSIIPLFKCLWVIMLCDVNYPIVYAVLAAFILVRCLFVC